MKDINRVPPVRVAEVAEVVAVEYGVSLDALRGRRRTAELACARHVAFLVASDFGQSFSAIGRYFRRDHTSVIHGCRRARAGGEAFDPERIDRVRRAVRPVFRHRAAPDLLFRSVRGHG